MQFYKKARNKKYRFTPNAVQLIRGGHDYFDTVLQLIDDAKETIHLHTYIFEADETGQLVANALIAAARRNLQVYLLVDGYASQGLPSAFITNLVDAGVHFRFFEPIFKSRHFYFGRRMHSKLLVVDSRKALIGGVNVTDRYNDMPGKPAWLDFALLAEGPVAVEVCTAAWRLWRGFQKQRRPDPCNPVPPHSSTRGYKSLVRLRSNDWVRNKLQISNNYLEMFRTATSHITILSSYALPGNIFRKNLQRAIRRGIKVKMIISGQSDVPFVKQAERYWYDWLMRNDIEIFEYTKNVLHGKLAVCDGERMTIGSYNVNDLSAYASIELNFDVVDPAFVQGVEKLLEDIIANDCIRVSKEELAKTSSLLTRFKRWFSYNVIRATFNLFTFYYRQQK